MLVITCERDSATHSVMDSTGSIDDRALMGSNPQNPKFGDRNGDFHYNFFRFNWCTQKIANKSQTVRIIEYMSTEH